MSEPVRFEQLERERDFYRQQGAVKERERIIELLEEEDCTCETDCNFHDELEYLIALIRGENK